MQTEMTPNGTNLLHGVNDAGELSITQGFEGASSEGEKKKKKDGQILLLFFFEITLITSRKLSLSDSITPNDVTFASESRDAGTLD